MADLTSGSWERAQEILGAALEMPPGERDGFVRAQCGDDADLYEEISSLLAASVEADAFFDGLADQVAEVADDVEPESEALVGRAFGHFDVVEEIGRGGMGEVYRAVDRKLNREVALKMLPTKLARNAEHVARFRREARLVAALNHPNIASIYGVEEFDDRIFLVLELVDGPTLRDRIAQGPIDVPEAVEIARQIAEAVEAAHDVSIVHRDLKPENVKIGPDGHARVLDFGIARSVSRRRDPGVDLDLSPATPVDVTVPGRLMGTASYMSPEQARGRPIDERTDVWAFGALLYEMLSGKKAFSGTDLGEVTAKILEAAPDWAALPATTPHSVRRLLERCLEKKMRRRLQAIGEARIVLEDVLDGADDIQDDSDTPRVGRTGVGLAAIAGGLILGMLLGRGEATEPVKKTLRLTVAEDASFPIISPGGEHILYQTLGAPWVVSLDGSAQRRLDAAAGGFPFVWSPNGERLAFYREGAIWSIPRGGGEASVLMSTGGRDVYAFAWLEDGRIAAGFGSELVALPETGGQAETLMSLERGDAARIRSLAAVPGGGVLAVLDQRRLVLPEHPGQPEIYSVDEGDIQDVYYASTDAVVFRRGGEDEGAWMLPLGGDGMASGAPLLVTDVDSPITVSREGDLVYIDRLLSRQMRRLIWVDRGGAAVDVLGQAQARIEQIDVSPSGRYAVSTAEDGGRRRLWVRDLGTGDSYALSPVPDPGQRWPNWSPDETRVAFRYDHVDPSDRWFAIKSLEPGTPPMYVGRGWYPAFHEDGTVLFQREDGVYRFDPESGETDFFFGHETFAGQPRPSTNGLVAYAGRALTGPEIFVTRFDDPGEVWQVSTSGGTRPRWRGDGRELFYRTGDDMVAVSVEFDGVRPRFGRPTVLFTLQDAGPWSEEYDPAPDGNRFLMVRPLPRTDPTDLDALVLIQNWDVGLRVR